MHLTDAQLDALADGELRPAPEAPLWHVAQCAACTEALARRKLQHRHAGALLETLDSTPPVVSSDDLIAQAMRGTGPRWRAIAAGIAAVSIGIGAAVALHGSRVGLHPHARSVAPVVHPLPAPRLINVGRTSSSPVTVTFASLQLSGEIDIILGDAPVVRVATRCGDASYPLTADGVVIDNAGSRASYEVTVPRVGSAVRIRVGNHVVFTRDGDGVHVAAGRPDGAGRYVILLNTLRLSAR